MSTKVEGDSTTALAGRSGPRTPCCWCILHRPGQAPNMVPVQVANSHGICPFCVEAVKGQVKARKALREARA